MPDKISFSRILLGSLLSFVVLAGLLVGFTYLRTQTLGESGVGECIMSMRPDSQLCASYAVFQHMWHPQWMAVQFSVYTLVASFLSFLFSRNVPAAPVLHGGMIGVMSALMLLSMLEPGRLSAVCAFVGGLLGGLIASSIRNKRNTAPVDEAMNQ